MLNMPFQDLNRFENHVVLSPYELYGPLEHVHWCARKAYLFNLSKFKSTDHISFSVTFIQRSKFFLGCTLTPKIGTKDRIVIGLGSYNPENRNPGKKCYFQTSDGTHKENDVSTKQLFISFNKINKLYFRNNTVRIHLLEPQVILHVEKQHLAVSTKDFFRVQSLQ